MPRIKSKHIKIFSLLAIIVLSILLGFSLRNLKTSFVIDEYLPKGDKEAEFFKEFGEKFGSNQLVFILAEANQTVFDTEFLKTLKRLQEEIKSTEGIANVISILNSIDIKKTEDGIEVADLIPEIPESKEEMDEIRSYIMSHPRFAGKIVSQNEKITNMYVYIKYGQDLVKVIGKIYETTERYKGDQIKSIYIGGMPTTVYFGNKYMRSDFSKLIPVSIVFMLIILFVFLGRVSYVVLALFSVILSLIWAFGLTSLFGIPLTISASIIPVIIIAIGASYGIHVISRYIAEKRENPTGAIRRTLKDIWVPVFMSAITTIAGFTSNVVTNFPPISNLGISVSFGVISATILSLVLIPVVISLRDERRSENGKASFEDKIEDFLRKYLSRLAGMIISLRFIIIFGWIGLAVLCAIFIPKVRTEMQFSAFYPEKSPPKVASEILRDQFSGSVPVFFLFKGDIKEPIVLREMERANYYLSMYKDMGSPQSIADLISEMNWKLYGSYSIPDTREQVANLWIFFEGNPNIKQIITQDNSEAVVISQFKKEESEEIIEVLKHLRKFEGERKFVKIFAEEIPKEKKNELNSYLISELEKNISFIDQGKHKIDFSEFRNHYITISEDLQENIVRSFVSEVQKYVESPESEIEISNSTDFIRHLVEKINNHKKDGISQNPKIIKEAVHYALQKSGNHNNSNDDLEGFISSIEKIFEDVERKERVEYLYSSLKINENSPEIAEKIKGQISYLLSTVFYIPKGVAEKIGLNGENTSFSIRAGGMPPLLGQLDKEIVSSQIESILFASIVIYIMLIIQLRSIQLSSIAMLPIILSVVIYLGFMGLINIPLDYGTLMISGVAIGTGIDYSIHAIHRLRKELVSFQYMEALQRSMISTGKAIIANTMAVSLAFLILVLSDLSLIERFGWVTALVMSLAAASALTIIPAILSIIYDRKNKKGIRSL